MWSVEGAYCVRIPPCHSPVVTLYTHTQYYIRYIILILLLSLYTHIYIYKHTVPVTHHSPVCWRPTARGSFRPLTGGTAAANNPHHWTARALDRRRRQQQVVFFCPFVVAPATTEQWATVSFVRSGSPHCRGIVSCRIFLNFFSLFPLVTLLAPQPIIIYTYIYFFFRIASSARTYV